MINLLFNPKTCEDIDFDSFPKEIACWFDSMLPDDIYVYLIDDEWFSIEGRSFHDFVKSCEGKILRVGWRDSWKEL